MYATDRAATFSPRNCCCPAFIIVLLVAILCSGTIQAQADRPINIAAIFALTGQAANANRSSVFGTRLAVEEINSRGGVLGRRLNLILLDNMSTPIGSNLAANQAVKAEVVGIVGAQYSSHSLVIAQVAQAHGIPMISNFSTHPELTQIGNYIFRVCFTDEMQGKVMADFARQELKASSAVVFVDLTSDYSLKLSDIFATHFHSTGGQVLGEIEYKTKSLDLDNLAERAANHQSDVIFLSGHEECGAIARRLQQSGAKGILLGGDGWGDKAFLDRGGAQLKHGYFCTHWSAQSDRVEARNFISKYSSHKDFGTGAALAYDAVMVLVNAIEDAGTTDGKKIASSLVSMPAHEGVTGTIKFNDTGDPLKSAVIMEIKNGVPQYHKTLAPH